MAGLSMQQLIVLVLASEIIDYAVVDACGALLQSTARLNTATLRRLQEGQISTERGMELSTRAAEAVDNVDFAWRTYKATRDTRAFVDVLVAESASFAKLVKELSD